MQRLAETYTVWAASVDPERYADAIVWWQRSVRLDPTNVPLRQTFEYAKTQMQAHVADLDAAAAAAPPDPSLWLQAAKGHAALGEAALARTDLGRVLDLDPGNREASDILGTLPP
jgi:tetratricopeptide (TPR) repeat protein